MRILHRTGRVDSVVEIVVGDAVCSVGDLLAALGSTPDPAGPSDIVIDDVAVTADMPLSAVTLCEGSVVDTTGAVAATRPARMLTVIGGIRAGAAIPLSGEVSVGRGADVRVRVDDPSMARRQFAIGNGTIRDLGSRDRIRVDGRPLDGPTAVEIGRTVRAGASRFTVRAHIEDRLRADPPRRGDRPGTIPFNRPPRVAPSVAPIAIPVPAAVASSPDAEPLSIVGIVLPVVAGVILAILFSPFLAVFAVLGPMLTIGTWWERRRRSRRRHRRAMSRLAQALTDLEGALPRYRESEIARRRSLDPDPAEVVRRMVAPSVQCWERRRGDPDAGIVALGDVDEPFRPRIVCDEGEPAPEAERLIAAQASMPDVPFPVDLSPGHVVGLSGDGAARAAVARSLVLQMATHHGPADLAVVVAAERPEDWAWARWLPHTTDPSDVDAGAFVVATRDVAAAERCVVAVQARPVFVVLDDPDPLRGRATAGRCLLRDANAAAVVLVDDVHRLPSACHAIMSVDALGRAVVVDPARAAGRTGVLARGVTVEVAERAARRMARLDDPDLPDPAAGIPASVALHDLLEIRHDRPEEVRSRWAMTAGTAALSTPIGLDGDGPVVLDLVADGPHLLIGGTTGSGKSELLRSIVAGLAVGADTDHLAVILIDYKGGAAFDRCADLPHVAGLVTDLDEDLAARALRCLDAELRHRERRLREAGVDDIVEFRHRCGGDETEPLPRLLVVVDEFASLAADLPDFLDALVGIAQRGRSLGVHLILATQRPAGVVTEDIRANAGCRIALRVTDRGDSVDVIGTGDASAIPRSRPGRAIARFGPDELATFQTALVTGHSAADRGVVVGRAAPSGTEPEGETDLRRLVAVVRDAHRARGGRAPRSPWPEPLPPRVVRGELGEDEGAAVGDWLLVDEPDRQRRSASRWDHGDGHLVVIGGPGAGSTTTLATAVIAAATAPSDRDRHVHIVDLDRGGLAALGALPAVGTVCGPADSARRERLLRWLDDEVARRRRSRDPGPDLLVVVDDFAGLARAHDRVRQAEVHEQVERIWAEGPGVGVVVATSLRRAGDLPANLVASAGTVLLHRTSDPSDGLRFGHRGSTARFGPGRAVRVADGALVQVVLADETLEAAIARLVTAPPPAAAPHDVGELADSIPFTTAVTSVAGDETGLDLTVAVRDVDLAPARLRLHRGEHALILGPPRSGRTNTLAAIARAAGAAGVVVGPDLAGRSGVDVAGLAAAIDERDAVVVIIDDCLDVEDPTGILRSLVDAPPPAVHIVAAARPDRFRAAYGHWAEGLRGSRAGFLLRPEPIDGDVLGVTLASRLRLRRCAGRGFLVADGVAEVVQVVRADQPV